MSCDPIGSVLASPALDALARHTPVPPLVRRLMEASATRLADSDMVVTESFAGFRTAEESRVKTPLPSPGVLHAIRALTDEVRDTGFGPHAARFFGLLGAIMIDLSGTPEQAAQVRGWVDQGKRACFAMTDRGGPLATDWNSALEPGEAPRLTVDKIWSMNANRSDFGIIIVRQGASMVLCPVLLAPEVFSQAETRQSGPAFLDGHLPLGDVKLVIDVADPSWVMRRGGPIGSKVFLTLARPWLIRALLGHVGWLEAQGRVRLDEVARAATEFLAQAARNQSALGYFDRFSEDQAMALKWIANETWAHLVTQGLVPGQGDARDLLGFSKMEGSSYRCFFEIYQRNKRFRDVAT